MSTASTLFTFTVLHKIQFVLFESAKIPFSPFNFNTLLRGRKLDIFV